MDEIKDKRKFFIQSLNMLDELKDSLTQSEKIILYESLESTLDIDDFTKVNIDEIISFLAVTPKQRKNTKKWQYNYIPITYSAYLVHLESFNNFIVTYFLFDSEISYRKNISRIAKISQANRQAPNLFFDETVKHYKQL
jgi:hypothetical protein